jgi:flagellar hook-length control protein FliK
MQITNQAPQAAAPSAASAQKPTVAAPGPFATLLRQSQSTRTAPADTAASPDAEVATSSEPDAPPEAEAHATQNTSNTPFKGRMRVADKAAVPRTAESGMKAGTKEAAGDTAANEKAEGLIAKRGETAIADPALAPWLVALQHPATETPPASGKNAPGAAALSPENLATTDTRPGTKADATSAAQDKAADAKARLDSSAASQTPPSSWLAASGPDSAAAQLAAQQLTEDDRSAKPVSTESAPHATALGAAAFNPLLGSTRENGAPLAVNLPTPLASPEFAQALGAQMSVLAADGVQHAELQLNPAEMGPVSVQIVIDGTNAQVDFGADLAATRQAIEAGLPELAGALRDAGFTLTGGGVSQHSGSRGGSQDAATHGGRHGHHGDGTGRGVDSGSLAAGAARQRRTVAAGGVDLYA